MYHDKGLPPGAENHDTILEQLSSQLNKKGNKVL